MTEDLLDRARRGDPDAWSALYEAITGRLLLWLRTRPSGDAAVAAEDVAAEAWLTAAQSIADFSGDQEEFAGWVFGIARTIVLETRRSTASTDPADTRDDPEAWGVTGAVDDEVAETDWVRRRLAALAPRDAEVIAAMDVAGLDARQTAAALGLSVAAVRVARHRGLLRLRRTS